MSATSAKLAALAVRLKNASGPDRHLDADLGVAFLGWSIEGEWLRTPDGSSYPARPGALYPTPTGSLDDARALLPEGLTAWRVGQGNIAWAVIGVGQYTIDYRDTTVQAATPELALCLARVEYELSKVLP